MWPNCSSVAKKCAKVNDENRDGKDLHKFKTTGMEDKRIVEKRKPANQNSAAAYQYQPPQKE